MSNATYTPLSEMFIHANDLSQYTPRLDRDFVGKIDNNHDSRRSWFQLTEPWEAASNPPLVSQAWAATVGTDVAAEIKTGESL